MKAIVDKLDINKLVNVPTRLNNLKTKVDNLDVDELKHFPTDLKKLNDVVSKEVVKQRVYNKLKTNLNNLEKKVTDSSTLIQTNQTTQINKI